MRRVSVISLALLVGMLVSGIIFPNPVQYGTDSIYAENWSGEAGVPSTPGTVMLPGQDKDVQPREGLKFVVDVEREAYSLGELVTIRSWFDNPEPDPLSVGGWGSSCISELAILSDSGDIVYNGTSPYCLWAMVPPIAVGPGVTPFSEGEWDMHYRIFDYGPQGEYVWSRTEELVPPGRYLVVIGLVGTSYEDSDWLTIVEPVFQD